MSYLQARGLALRYAQEYPLFQAVDFEINPGDRIAIVGPNGAGKSSLLRILAGEQAADAGTLAKRRGLVHAVFAQANPADGNAQSTGQRAYTRLAEILADPADVLYLDEPTNHLDAKGRRWLAHQILRRETTCVFVSHDEDFLLQMATRVFEIRRGEFRVFNVGYAAYLERTQQLQQQTWSAYEDEQRQLAALERAARRRDALASRVAKMPVGGSAAARPFYNAKAAKVARTARMLRERIQPEARIAKPWEEQPIPKLDFRAATRPSDPPITLDSLTLSYGAKPVVTGFQLTLRRGERAAITGPNGAGKTTLFKAILGRLAPECGVVMIGQNVHLGYFAQEAETLNPTETPLTACLRECPDRTWVQTILACLKLPRTLVEVPISQLSLGERTKTALAQLLVSKANVLLLDEPTNHLEIDARHALLETLRQWPGTLLVVSHDEAFLDHLEPVRYPLTR